MRSIYQKLKSESGASFLLALLFFLICLMVGSSVLMAAVSNAGKTRSNQREQQAYMVLSSAMKLVTDDMTQAAYYGRFQYKVSYAPGAEPSDPEAYHFTRQEGILAASLPTGGDPGADPSGGGGLSACDFDPVFRPAMDKLFAAYMKQEKEIHDTSTANPRIEFEPSDSGMSLVELTGTFTFQSQTAELADFEVSVTWTLRDNYAIDLTAALTRVPAEYGDVKRYAPFEMKAELTPVGNPPAIDTSAYTSAVAEGSYTTNPMTWKLGWITGPNEE